MTNMRFAVIRWVFWLAMGWLMPQVLLAGWDGGKEESFVLDGRACRVVVPEHPAAGRPWIWRPEFFEAFNQADRALLKKGYHLAWTELANSFGCPSSLERMDRFHREVVTRYHVSERAVLFGFSRGGLYSLNWAERHPERVSCLYLDAPVCDFISWPAGKGKGAGSPGDWKKLIVDYGFADEAAALSYRDGPLHHLGILAKARIPVLCVVGDADRTVPVEENTALLESGMKNAGGMIRVIHKPGVDHHPHSLSDPAPVVEFVERVCKTGVSR